MEHKADIGIIGGSGLGELLQNAVKIKVHTPYGNPSDLIHLGELGEKKVAFLPRHGSSHTLPPHLINFRANIWALKSLGVQAIFAPCAVGSLQEEVSPGEFVFVSQFIDRTHGRESSFYAGPKVCHISVAEPTCRQLRELLAGCAKDLGFSHHTQGTYVCVNGPRFSTRAESALFRSWGADVIGMTLVPECVLAREAEICYASIAMVTDYDVWKDKPVDMEMIVRTVKENETKINRLLTSAVRQANALAPCDCKVALRGALV